MFLSFLALLAGGTVRFWKTREWWGLPLAIGALLLALTQVGTFILSYQPAHTAVTIGQLNNMAMTVGIFFFGMAGVLLILESKETTSARPEESEA